MNNNEARAYAALAMEKAGIPAVQIGAAMGEMWDLFDRLTVEEAAHTGGSVVHRSILAHSRAVRGESRRLSESLK